MDRKLYMNSLYDYYGELLTKKQKEYFEEYYFRDFSLGEIAINMGVSRNAVYNQLKNTEEKLEFFERVLRLYNREIKIRRLIRNLDEETIAKIEELI